MSVNTPKMGLIQPTIGIDSGLVWEQSINADLGIIDGHNHSNGYGVQIQPNGLDISSDLPFLGNNATLLRTVRFLPQLTTISNVAPDQNCLYVSGVDLYYNDGAGSTPTRMTAGGAVNATSSGISSGTNSASFVSSVLVVNSASNAPANINGGSILIGNPGVAGSNFVTLAAPSALSPGYTLTLPTALVGGSGGLMFSGATGTLSYVEPDNSTLQISGSTLLVKSGGITATQIASGTITSAQISASAGITNSQLAALNYTKSSSCGTFSVSGGSLTSITNMNINITSTRPVCVGIMPDQGSTSSLFNTANGVSANGTNILIYRNSGTLVTRYQSLAPTNEIIYFPLSISFIDFSAPAGVNNYTAYLLNFNGSTTAYVYYFVLYAYEL